MSRTHHKERKKKRGHKEWWGARPFAYTSVANRGMAAWKRLLHKAERNIDKRIIKNELEE